MNKPVWESSDQDIVRFFKQSADPTGAEVEPGSPATNPIPYRFYKLDRKSTKSRWTRSVDRTVFRFFGDIQFVSSDKGWSEVVADNVTIRRQMMLALWNDIGPVTGDKIPWYLRDMPVPGFGPLSMAYGYLRAGNPDRYLVDKKEGPKWHPVKGMRPLKMYWVSALVTRYVENDEGEIERTEFPAILLLKEWQMREITSTLEVMREMKGGDWDITGFPFHIVNLTLQRQQDTGLKMTPAGAFDPSDKEVYDMSKHQQPSFAQQGEALVSTLEEFLVEHNSPIKDFPYPGAHAEDGWTTLKPYATVQYEEYLANTGESKVEDRYADRSLEELRVLADEYGVKVPKNASRAKVIAAIEDSVPF